MFVLFCSACVFCLLQELILISMFYLFPPSSSLIDLFTSPEKLTISVSQDPAPENAGMYKCVVKNKFGEINANLSLNIEIAPVIRERPIIRKVEKKKSVVLQCAVQGSQDIEVQWFKEGTAINLDNQERFTIEKKKSEQREGETIVQLEIQDTDVSDQGIYQLVAKSETGETQSQTVTLQEDQVKMEAAEASPEADTASASVATEESAVKKKKKKVVKKKKKKEEEVTIPKPELSSYLKNFVSIQISHRQELTQYFASRSRKRVRASR